MPADSLVQDCMIYDMVRISSSPFTHKKFLNGEVKVIPFLPELFSGRLHVPDDQG